MAPNIFLVVSYQLRLPPFNIPPYMIFFLKINYIIIYTIVIYLYFSKIQP